jgi:hypothetical protein
LLVGGVPGGQDSEDHGGPSAVGPT